MVRPKALSKIKTRIWIGIAFSVNKTSEIEAHQRKAETVLRDYIKALPILRYHLKSNFNK